MPDYGEFNEKNPWYRLKILADRVDALTREKEKLESDMRETRSDMREARKDIEGIRRSISRGAGVLLAFPIFGSALGILIAYGKYIFGTGKGP